jgi:hypothetical protein
MSWVIFVILNEPHFFFVIPNELLGEEESLAGKGSERK